MKTPQGPLARPKGEESRLGMQAAHFAHAIARR